MGRTTCLLYSEYTLAAVFWVLTSAFIVFLFSSVVVSCQPTCSQCVYQQRIVCEIRTDSEADQTPSCSRACQLWAQRILCIWMSVWGSINSSGKHKTYLISEAITGNQRSGSQFKSVMFVWCFSFFTFESVLFCFLAYFIFTKSEWEETNEQKTHEQSCKVIYLKSLTELLT